MTMNREILNYLKTFSDRVPKVERRDSNRASNHNHNIDNNTNNIEHNHIRQQDRINGHHKRLCHEHNQ